MTGEESRLKRSVIQWSGWGVAVALIVVAILVTGIWALVPRAEGWTPDDRSKVREFAAELTRGNAEVVAVQFEDGTDPFLNPHAMAVAVLEPDDPTALFTDVDFAQIRQRLSAAGWTSGDDDCSATVPQAKYSCGLTKDGQSIGRLDLTLRGSLKLIVAHRALEWVTFGMS